MNASVLGTNSSAAGYGYGFGEQVDGHDPSTALQSCVPGSGWMENPCDDYSVPVLLLAIVAAGAVVYRIRQRLRQEAVDFVPLGSSSAGPASGGGGSSSSNRISVAVDTTAPSSPAGAGGRGCRGCMLWALRIVVMLWSITCGIGAHGLCTPA